MSDTPRVDAYAVTAPGIWPDSELRWAAFARELERELAVMTAAKNKALDLAKAFSERLESRECDRCSATNCCGEAECFAHTRKLIAELEAT